MNDNKKNKSKTHHYSQEEISHLKPIFSKYIENVPDGEKESVMIMLSNIENEHEDTINKTIDLYKRCKFHKFTGVQSINGPVSFSYILKNTSTTRKYDKKYTLDYDYIRKRFNTIFDMMSWKFNSCGKLSKDDLFNIIYKDLITLNCIYESQIYDNVDLCYNIDQEVKNRMSNLESIDVYNLCGSYRLFRNTIPVKSFQFETYDQMSNDIDKIVVDEIIKHGTHIENSISIDKDLDIQIFIERVNIGVRTSRNIANTILIPEKYLNKMVYLGIENIFDNVIMLPNEVLKDKIILTYCGNTSYDNGLIVSPYILYDVKQNLPNDLIDLKLRDILLSKDDINLEMLYRSRFALSTYDDSSESCAIEQVKNYYTIFSIED